MNQPQVALDAALAVRLISSSALGSAVAALAATLALGSAGRFAELEHVLGAALAAGTTRDPISEALLMIHLFGGFPRAIESFRVFDRVCPPAAAPPVKPVTTVEPLDSERRAAGLELFRRIYGSRADQVLEQLTRSDPALAEAVVTDAYGRILSRPTLTARVRELMAITALAVLSLPRQLESHVRGALACGATPVQVRAAADFAVALGGDAVAALALPVVERNIAPD